MRRFSALAIVAVIASSLAVTSAPVADAKTGRAGLPSATLAAVPLTIMEFNIEYGGTGGDFSKVVEAIQTSGASLVAIEEAYGHMRRLARQLGWPYYDPQRQLVSQYPLFAPPDGDTNYAYVGVGGGAVAIANVHLPSWPYSPAMILHKDATLKQVLAAENRGRVPKIESVIGSVSGSPGTPMALGVPTLVAGDFNSPSNLDWTSAMVGARPQIKYPVDWPMTRTLQDAGFADSFRAIYPDPATEAGLTWPAGRPKIPGAWNPPADAPQDRIDYIFSDGAATPTDSGIMGEPGGPGVWRSVDPWPSDHRAMVSTFDVVPGTPPALVSPSPRLVTTGDTVTTNYLSLTVSPGNLCWQRLSGVVSVANCLASGAPQGQWGFSASMPGRYRVTLRDASDAVIASAPFWVQAPGSHPEVGTGKSLYASGEPVRVWWRNSPGNRWDWVGIYRRGANPHVAYYLDWAYTDTRGTSDPERRFARAVATPTGEVQRLPLDR